MKIQKFKIYSCIKVGVVSWPNGDSQPYCHVEVVLKEGGKGDCGCFSIGNV